MSGLREWLLEVVSVALALSLAQSLTPKGAVREIGRLIGGGVLLLAVVRPLFALDLGQLSGESILTGAYGEVPETVADSRMDLLSAGIAERTQAYIAEQAQALGTACRVEVSVEVDENGWPIPVRAVLWGRWTGESRAAMSALLEEELAIPVAGQEFREESGEVE